MNKRSQTKWIVLPKGCQNGTNIDAKTHTNVNAQTGSEKDHEYHQTNCFADVWKDAKPSQNQLCLKVLQIECETGKGINKNINNDTRIHRKIDEESKQNLCSKE